MPRTTLTGSPRFSLPRASAPPRRSYWHFSTLLRRFSICHGWARVLRASSTRKSVADRSAVRAQVSDRGGDHSYPPHLPHPRKSMKLTWFGGTTLRIHMGGKILLCDAAGAP